MTFKKTLAAAAITAVAFTTIPLSSFAEEVAAPPAGVEVSVLSSVDDSTTTTIEVLAPSTEVPTTTVATSTTSASPTTASPAKAPTKAVKAPAKPFTAAQIRYLRAVQVNNIVYNWGDPKPAMEAFRLVALNRGWTEKQIKSWEIAIANIMMGESGFCPNVLRGAVMANPKGCVLKRQGRHSDAGFGQLIGIHYKLSTRNPAAGFLCREEGMCSKWQIIASPYNSMLALVALIERSGTGPWCYNNFARRYHRIACSNPGMNVP